MTKKIVFTEHAPAAIGPYSQAVVAGNMVFCSGQIAIDPASGELKKGTVAEQTELVLRNMKAVLEAAGSKLENVVKTGVFLADMGDFAEMNEVYARYFPENPPARACVAVRTLPKEVDVEIECVALVG